MAVRDPNCQFQFWKLSGHIFLVDLEPVLIILGSYVTVMVLCASGAGRCLLVYSHMVQKLPKWTTDQSSLGDFSLVLS